MSREIRMTPTGTWLELGATYGLSRYTDDAPDQAEQVYVAYATEPRLYPHPDGGKLEPRVYQIRRGRGYSIPVVLELTAGQAVEMAKIILEHAGEGAELFSHPRDRWDADRLRTEAAQISKLLNSFADQLDGGAR